MLQIFSLLEMAMAKLPFEVDERQVLYFDNGQAHPLNTFVSENLLELKRIFALNGLQFCHVFQGKIDTSDLEDQIRYCIPWLDEEDSERLANLKTLTEKELENVFSITKEKNAAAFFGEKDKLLTKIDISKPELFMTQFTSIAKNYGQSLLRKYGEDAVHDDELISLLQELAIKKPKGIVRAILKGELEREDRIISRIIINRNGDVVLPEYNKKVHLAPKEMALYSIYLRHPEGFPLMDLYDQERQKEFATLYRYYAKRGTLEQIDDAIQNFFNNPNEINTQHSRIKRAFVKAFDEDIAENYIITGKAGDTMRITLPRDKVEGDLRF